MLVARIFRRVDAGRHGPSHEGRVGSCRPSAKLSQSPSPKREWRTITAISRRTLLEVNGSLET